MPQTMDYTALGIMMAKQVRLMTKAIRQLNAVVDTAAPASVRMVSIIEILRTLDTDLEEVS